MIRQLCVATGQVEDNPFELLDSMLSQIALKSDGDFPLTLLWNGRDAKEHACP